MADFWGMPIELVVGAMTLASSAIGGGLAIIGSAVLNKREHERARERALYERRMDMASELYRRLSAYHRTVGSSIAELAYSTSPGHADAIRTADRTWNELAEHADATAVFIPEVLGPVREFNDSMFRVRGLWSVGGKAAREGRTENADQMFQEASTELLGRIPHLSVQVLQLLQRCAAPNETRATVAVESALTPKE